MWRLTIVAGLVAIAACGGDHPWTSGTIDVALLAPKSGPLEFVGDSFERVANVAIANINERGGVDGRELVLAVRDTATTPTVAAERLQDLIDEGYVAVVGPATSDEVEATYGIARDSQVPIMSPSSTAPFLSDVDDGGYMFRNVPDDSIQGVAMAYYLAVQREQVTRSVYFVYENTTYGLGLLSAFTDAYGKVDGSVVDMVPFTQGLQALCCPAATACPATGTATGCALQPISPETVACGTAGDPTVGGLPETCAGPEAIAVIDDLVATSIPDGSLVVLVGLEQDDVQVVLAWDNAGAPRIPGLQFFMTDGARSQGFRARAPASARGMCGTAPTYPVDGVAYTKLRNLYAAAYDGADVGQEVYAPNVWDAFHLFAAAMLLQAHEFPDEPLGGPHLIDSLARVSRDGQQYAAGEWRNIILDIRDGNDIDYDGAGGPNDFEANGQALGPYEVWCLADDGATFDQIVYLTAEDIRALGQ